MTLYTGQLLQNRYEIIKLLARGGMGAVYLAADRRLGGRYCAVKEQLPDSNVTTPEKLNELRKQFHREANVLGSLEHPNLPNVTDFFSDSGNEYLIMEYVEGKNLENVLTERGAPLPEGLVLEWTKQLFSALEKLHGHQPYTIIHRDIKPGNIILQSSNQIKLVDFGLVKLLDPSKPLTVEIVRGRGTPAYTPIEQYGTSGNYTDARSDIYALAATLYHLLTNVVPPEAALRLGSMTPLAPLQQYNPQLSPRTCNAILKAMAMAPKDRFQNIPEFRAALFENISSPIFPPPPVIPPSPTPTPTPKRGVSGLITSLAVLAIVLLLVIIGMIAFLISSSSNKNSENDSAEKPIETKESRNESSESISTNPPSETFPTSTVACIFASSFVEDVTVPDGTTIPPGEKFTKTWRMKNSGTCDWPSEGHRIVFAEGNQLGALASRPMPATKVDEEVDIWLDMQAPNEPGYYEGTWELWNEKGEAYGHLTIIINVAEEEVQEEERAEEGTQEEEEDNSPVEAEFETRFAFASEREGNSEIYIQNDNGSFLRLTNNSTGDWKPTWSPDGTMIAFESDRDQNYELYRMDADGSNQINLTNHASNDSWPTWSSTGYIAFQSNRDKNWEIYLMEPDGDNLINLTNSPKHELQPAWSPNGRQIAFISSISRESELWDIYVMNSDGTNIRQLTTHEGADMYPAWSPDGNQIAFSSFIDNSFELYIMNSDGSGKRRLTMNPDANDLESAWHPTGAYLTFTSNLNGTDNEIYFIDTDGNNLSNLTKSAGHDRWSIWWP